MRIPEETINQIIERLDIAELIGGYVSLTKKGNRYWGLCPFHNEKTPSFTVTPDRGVFYCFGCHKGGSVLTFMMEIEKLSFLEAVQFAAKKAGVELSHQSDRTQMLKKDAFLDLYKRVTLSFQHLLLQHEKGEQARRYLVGRKIDEETQKQFLLGYAPPEREWLYEFLKSKNYSDDFLAQSGLFVRGKQPYFSHRIMFPIINTRDEIVAFGGRALADTGPKYLNSPETSIFNKGSTLYGINLAFSAIREKGCFYLVEGYLDVIAMHRAGLENCVAPLGTALTERQTRLLKRYAGKAVLFFDSDEAGIKATLRALEILESCGMEADVVDQDTLKDPADIFEKDGGETLQKVVQYTINGFQYILKRAITHIDIATPGGKERVLEIIAPYLSIVQSELRREAYIEMTAEALSTRVETVQHDLLRLKRAPFKKEQKAAEIKPPEITDELFFMLAAAIGNRTFEEVRKQIRVEDFQDPHAKELYIACEECFRNDENSIEQIAARIESDQIKMLLIEKASSDEFSINQEKLIADGIRAILQKSLERRRVNVLAKLKEHEKRHQDFLMIRDLQLEIMNIDEELKKLKTREYGRNN